MTLWRDDYDDSDLRPMEYDFTRSNDLGFTPTPIPCDTPSLPEQERLADQPWVRKSLRWLVLAAAAWGLACYVGHQWQAGTANYSREMSRTRTVTVGMETRR